MTDAQKYAKVFRAATNGVDAKLAEMRQQGGYLIRDYDGLDATARSFAAIADLFDKIAEAERPDTPASYEIPRIGG